MAGRGSVPLPDRCPGTQATILGPDGPICSLVACDHSAETAGCQTPDPQARSSRSGMGERVGDYILVARLSAPLWPGGKVSSHLASGSQRLAAVGS